MRRRAILAGIAAFLLAAGGTPGFAASGPVLLAVPGGHLRLFQRGAATVLAFTGSRPATRLVLSPEDGIFPGSLDGGRVVGVIPGRVLILRLTYASRPNGSSHMCGAGTEAVLTVVALRPVPRQTFRQRVESCWQDIDPGDVGWDAATTRLSVERTSFKEEPPHRRARYRVDPDGTTTLLDIEGLP